MKHLQKIFIIGLLIFCANTEIFGQDRESSEVGFFVGISAFSTDYGERREIRSSGGGNTGFGIGAMYYLNFTDYRYRWNQRTSYFSEHARLRIELSYLRAKLNHFGEYAEKDSPGGEQLRAMHGIANVLNGGAQMEFHWVDIVDYGSRRLPDIKWSPYVSAGLWLSFYDADLYSDLGDWQEDPSVLFPKWAEPGTTRIKPGISSSVTMSLGTRYAIGEYADIFIEARWRYYFTNWVDGLDAKDDPANKYNDWNGFVHVGYIYYLN